MEKRKKRGRGKEEEEEEKRSRRTHRERRRGRRRKKGGGRATCKRVRKEVASKEVGGKPGESCLEHRARESYKRRGIAKNKDAAEVQGKRKLEIFHWI
jgi:hypothetical protein